MLIVLSFFPCSTAYAQDREAELKAVFLFNFTQFVEWPAHAFATTNSPFVIGVAGPTPVETPLIEITRGETVRGHPIEIRSITDPSETTGTHILFVSRNFARRWLEVRRALGTLPVLTVGETDNFARRGGVIELYLRDNKVRFRVNPPEARQGELLLSSKLLRLAEIVPAD